MFNCFESLHSTVFNVNFLYLILFLFNLILFNSIHLARTAGRLVLRRPMYLNSLWIVVPRESCVCGVLIQPSLYSSPRCVPRPCMQRDCSHLIWCLNEPLYIEKNGTWCSCCELICSIPADKNFHTWQAVGYSRQEKSAECLINLIWRGGGWTMYTDREISLECKCPDPTFLVPIHGRFSQFYHMKHVQQLLGRTPAPALTKAIWGPYRIERSKNFAKGAAKSTAQAPLFQMGVHWTFWILVYEITRDCRPSARELPRIIQVLIHHFRPPSKSHFIGIPIKWL